MSDLNLSTHFYESQFGWKRSDASNANISFFTLNGIMLALFDRNELADDATMDAEGNGFKAFTLAYNTRSEQEVDDLIEELRAKGVKIIKEPQRVSWEDTAAISPTRMETYGRSLLTPTWNLMQQEML